MAASVVPIVDLPPDEPTENQTGEQQPTADENGQQGLEEETEEPPKKKQRASGGTPRTPRTPRTEHNWVRDRKFESAEEAVQYVKNEECWSTAQSYDSVDGRKVFYRCNQVRKRAPKQCPAKIYLLYHADSIAVSLFRTEATHDHDQVEYTHGLDKNTRTVVQQLFDDGTTKARQVMAAIRAMNMKEPTMRSLQNFLNRYRKKKFGIASINFNELGQWCNEHSTPATDDPNMPFIVRHTNGRSEDGTKFFRIFLSSPRLLQFAVESDVLQIDSTYTLNWQDFPVIIVGTSDKDLKFFPIGVAMCSGDSTADFDFIFRALADGIQRTFNVDYAPKVLVADANDVITNAFTDVYGADIKRVTCWDHAARAIDQKLKNMQDRDKRNLLRQDIAQLQQCPAEDTFNAAVALFFDKWFSGHDGQEVEDFLTYFEMQWIRQHCNWYEGYAPHAPSNNKGLEALVTAVKNEQQLRPRLPFGQFMGILREKLLYQWAEERDPNSWNAKHFSTAPTRTMAVWSKAYQWSEESKSKQLLRKRREDGLLNLYIASEKTPTLTPAFVSAYKTAFQTSIWQSFDEYVQMRNAVWVVCINEQDWEHATCNCPTFLKDYICEHSLGAAIRLDLCDVPAEARSPLSPEKRKSYSGKPRGRPPRAVAQPYGSSPWGRDTSSFQLEPM